MRSVYQTFLRRLSIKPDLNNMLTGAVEGLGWWQRKRRNQMTEQYKQGWKDKASFKSLKDCPYKRGSNEAKRWCAGWYDANRDPVLQSEMST